MFGLGALLVTLIHAPVRLYVRVSLDLDGLKFRAKWRVWGVTVWSLDRVLGTASLFGRDGMSGRWGLGGQYLASRYRIAGFEAKLRFGLGDAAATAMAAGLVHVICGVALGILGRRWIGSGAPRFSVVPEFNKLTGDVQVRCILLARAGHYIVAGWLQLWEALRNRVRGVAAVHSAVGRTNTLDP